MRETAFWRIRLFQIRRQPTTNGRIEQSSRGKTHAMRQVKLLIKMFIRHLIIAWGMQYEAVQGKIRCKNMKRGFQVLEDK